MNYNQLKEAVKFELQSASKSTGKSSYEKRVANINFIHSINLRELKHNKNEKRILIHETIAGEKIYIQYPGKESVRKEDKKYKYDLRPKIKLSNGSYYKDLAFKQIWDTLENKIINLASNNENYLKLLMALFYRMAFMADHEKAVNKEMETQTLKIKKLSTISETNYREIISDFYLYVPNINVIKELSNVLGDFDGLSLEAFLYYNDLLGLNEDCKYYYKAKIKNKKKTKWLNRIGRINTILRVCKVFCVNGFVILVVQ